MTVALANASLAIATATKFPRTTRSGRAVVAATTRTSVTAAAALSHPSSHRIHRISASFRYSLVNPLQCLTPRSRPVRHANPSAGFQVSADSRTARVHWHRPDGAYSGFGLHVFGDVIAETGWDEPLQPSGTDDFGVFFDVPVAPDANQVSFIVHMGDNKENEGDLSLPAGVDGEYWILSGDGTPYADVRALLNAGVEVSAQDKDGWTTLMAAALSGETEKVSTLLNAGANVSSQNKDGWTALMMAAQTGQAETINALLSAGADANMQTKEGWTALIMTATKGHVDAFHALLSAGADANVESVDGCTALSRATFKGHTEIVEALGGEVQS